jgi:hypothetical protein
MGGSAERRFFSSQRRKFTDFDRSARAAASAPAIRWLLASAQQDESTGAPNQQIPTHKSFHFIFDYCRHLSLKARSVAVFGAGYRLALGVSTLKPNDH